MKTNCLNLTFANGAILNLNKRKEKRTKPCVNLLQYSNDEITICFWQLSLYIQKFNFFYNETL